MDNSEKPQPERIEYATALSTLRGSGPIGAEIAEGLPDPKELVAAEPELRTLTPEVVLEPKPRHTPGKKLRGMGEIFLRGHIFRVAYHVRGKRFRESSESTNRAVAVRLLKQRIADVKAGKPVGANVEKTTFADLKNMVIADYVANQRKSLKRVKISLAHLNEFFPDYLARDISTDRVTAYIAHRRDQKAANATINRELAALRRAFTLAWDAKKVADRPKITMLVERNTRKGFFERAPFEAVRDQLPAYLRPVVEVAYITGWRVKDELLTRHRHHLDLAGGWLRLEPGETKNGEGRNFPLTPKLREVLTAQVERTRARELQLGRVIPYLFHHNNGTPIKDFRTAWESACDRAELAGRIPHDFRRTAARNLESAGVSRSAAMAMMGHKTQSMYSRYAIADQTSLREAGVKLAALEKREKRIKKPVKKVIKLRTGKAAAK